MPCGHNPVDAVWTNHPPPPLSPVRRHGLEYAGESASSKIERIARSLADKDCDAAVISDPTSIAWLLNIRGGDLPGTPVCLGFAIVRKEGTVTLYTDRRKFTPEALECCRKMPSSSPSLNSLRIWMKRPPMEQKSSSIA